MAYTFSKFMGLLTDTAAANGQNGAPSNEQWNYGRQSYDRTHNATLTYSYDIPGVAKRSGIKGLGIVTDHWNLSGITSLHSGAPYAPGCSLVSGSPSIAGGYTGRPDITQRRAVIGNPYSGIPTNGNGQVYFNAAEFAMPTVNTTGPSNSVVGPPALGNLGGGSGNLSLPRVNQLRHDDGWGVPAGQREATLKIQVQVTNLQTLGYVNATPTNSQRIVAFTARFQY
jgi:hypothetical protein